MSALTRLRVGGATRPPGRSTGAAGRRRPPEDVPLVFDRFWRAERARGTPGSGLGLAIVRQVADQHGAVIAVETPADGGTRMRLRFPS